MPKIFIGIIAAFVVLLIIIPQTLFTIDETQMAIVTRLGAFKSSYIKPGLRIKTPFIESVTKFDKRLLRVDARPASLLTADKRNLSIDVYARYRIVDPLKFFKNLQTELEANSRVGNIVNSQLRQEVAMDLQSDVISGTREEIMRRVTIASNRIESSRAEVLELEGGLTNPSITVLITPKRIPGGPMTRSRNATSDEVYALINSASPDILEGFQIDYLLPLSTTLGVEIVDVRIKRADFPADVADSVYSRMEAERQRIASGLRAEGNQKDLEIRAEVDKEVQITLQTAEGTAALLVGEGEREAIKILAEALEMDPEFYEFQRTLEMYRNTLANTDTTIVLDADSELFKFLQDPMGTLPR